MRRQPRKNKKLLIILIPLSILMSGGLYLHLTRAAPPDETELELFFRAAAAYDSGEYQTAVRLTEALSKGNRNFHQARLLRAKAEFFSGEYEKSGMLLRKLTDDFALYTEARIWLTRSLLHQGRTEAAKEEAEELLRWSDEDPRILGLLARTALAEQDYREAIEFHKRAALFEEDLAINRIELAGLYLRLSNREEAERNLRRSLSLLPGDSPLRPGVVSILENGEL